MDETNFAVGIVIVTGNKSESLEQQSVPPGVKIKCLFVAVVIAVVVIVIVVVSSVLGGSLFCPPFILFCVSISLLFLRFAWEETRSAKTLFFSDMTSQDLNF